MSALCCRFLSEIAFRFILSANSINLMSPHIPCCVPLYSLFLSSSMEGQSHSYIWVVWFLNATISSFDLVSLFVFRFISFYMQQSISNSLKYNVLAVFQDFFFCTNQTCLEINWWKPCLSEVKRQKCKKKIYITLLMYISGLVNFVLKYCLYLMQ